MSGKNTTEGDSIVSPTSNTVHARRELLARVEIADLPRDVLIDSVVGGEGYEREFVENALDGLEKTGEVYVVDNEVRRT